MRGTKVGQAYVAITADGSGINDAIADAFEKPDYSDFGDRVGKDTAARLEKHLEDNVNPEFSKAVKGMGKAIDNDDTIRASIAAQLSKSFSAGDLDPLVKKVGRDSGRSLGGALGDEFDDAIKVSILETLESAMYDAARRGEKGGEQLRNSILHGMATGDGDVDILGPLHERMVESAARAMDKIEKDSLKTQEALAKAQTKADESRLRERLAYEQMYENLLIKRDRERMEADQKAADNWEATLNQAYAEHHRFRQRLARKAAAEEVRAARNTAKERSRADRVGDVVGRMLGRGSRNNFLNLLGGTAGGLTKMVLKPLGLVTNMMKGAIKGAVSLGKAFTDGFSNAAEGASFLGKVMSGFGKSGAQGMAMAGRGMAALASSSVAAAAALPALVIALGVVAVAVVALVTVLGALLGIVAALASTIVSALVGALAVAGGAILALVAAGGLLTAAFMSMSEAQKKVLSANFAPLKDSLKEIGSVMAGPLVKASSTWASNLKSSIDLLMPTAKRMGDAFAIAGNRLTASFSGPGFQAFAQAMETYLPSITRKMATALGGFLNGLLGTFAVIMPKVNQFAKYLKDVGTNFSKWASSGSGKTSIENFVDRAVTQFQKFNRFVKEATGLVSDLLFSKEAQSAGGGMFDGMTRGLESLRRKLQDASNDGSLQTWFDDVRKFANRLADAFTGIKDVLVELYDSGMLDKIGQGISDVGTFLTTVSPYIDDMKEAWKAATKAWKDTSWLGIVTSALSAAGSAVKGLLELLGLAEGKAKKTGDAAYKAMTAAEAAASAKDRQGSGEGAPKPGTTNRTAASGNSKGLLGAVADALKGQDQQDQRRGKPDKTKTVSSTDVAPGGSVGRQRGKKGRKRFVLDKRLAAFARRMIVEERFSINKEIDALEALIKTDYNSMLKDALTVGTSGEQVTDSIKTITAGLRTDGKALVEAAQAEVNEASRELLNARNAKEAKAARAKLNKATADLAKANQQAAQMAEAGVRLDKQAVMTWGNIEQLLKGNNVYGNNNTLADYAEARLRMADMIEEADARLKALIEEQSAYRQSITDNAKAYGSLLTAQARSLNGVEQALSHTDITTNLQDRLAKIKKFQSTMQSLLAMGLSQDVYKQLVDAGVDGGSAYAEALLEGGLGAVNSANSLTEQIAQASGALGAEASTVLYQAGVDTAQGFLDGLTALDAQLANAATALGQRIAAGVAAALGIQSPSRVAFGLMRDDFGDGMVLGLNAAGPKVDVAARNLANRVAVSPEVAAYASRRGTSPLVDDAVSGNRGVNIGEVNVHTPTENPAAVANEVINQIVGRL